MEIATGQSQAPDEFKTCGLKCQRLVIFSAGKVGRFDYLMIGKSAVARYAVNMIYVRDDFENLPTLPHWATAKDPETYANVTFRSGAVLGVLDHLITASNHEVPKLLLANTLALSAAEATSKLEGRLARAVDIRDAFHLTPAGQARGPDGDSLAFWREAVSFRLADKDLTAALAKAVGATAMDVENWLKTAKARTENDGILAGCVCALENVLAWDDRAERTACLMSDVVLAQRLGWTTLLPVTALRLTKPMLRDLSAGNVNAELVVQSRVLAALEDTIGQAGQLSKRAEALRRVAPKLRAKGADAAVQVFLTEDAVAPSSMLSPFVRGTTLPMTSRAARRFCDRLVELGVVRELTGRATFRLYGIGG